MHHHEDYNCSDDGKFVVGRISQTDPANGLVKVVFDADMDDDDDDSPGTFETDWIPFLVRKSQNCKETFPFDIGEQVVCLMDTNWEEGTVLGCTYNDEDLPDGAGEDIYRILYKDGSFEMFDRSSGDKTVSYKGILKMSVASGKKIQMVAADGGEIDIADKLTIKNTSEDLKTLLTDMVNAWVAQTYTNGAGVTGPPNNVTDFNAFLTRINNLFT